tara:strand:+ start:1616 stop:1906 length:291 start_codon:yes stop_codon:yes gene_type:complete
MGKVKQNWKEQLKKLKETEVDQAVVSLKKRVAKENKEKVVKIKFLGKQKRDNKRRENNATRIANTLMYFFLDHKVKESNFLMGLESSIHLNNNNNG